MATRPKLITAKELLLMPDNDMQHELIRGVLTEDILPGDQHGIVVARIGWLLGNFSDDNDFGEMSGRSGFLLERNPDTVRCPDLAWVASGRLDKPVPSYAELAPDLVVEVRSPNDSQWHMAERAMMWLSLGVRMVLVADPGPVTLAVYRPGEPPQVLGEFESFDEGDVLPGFTAPVWSFFPHLE